MTEVDDDTERELKTPSDWDVRNAARRWGEWTGIVEGAFFGGVAVGIAQTLGKGWVAVAIFALMVGAAVMGHRAFKRYQAVSAAWYEARRKRAEDEANEANRFMAMLLAKVPVNARTPEEENGQES